MSPSGVPEFIRQNKQALAQRASKRYFDRHPGFSAWKSGVEHTLEDTTYTLDFLATSIELKSAEAFTGYFRWLRTVLESRKLDVAMILESIDDIQGSLDDHPEAATAAAPFLAAARSGLGQELGTESHLDDRQSAYLQAVLNAERRVAMKVVEECVRDSEPASVYSDVIAPTMHEIGRLWQTNRITVAREHTATAISQYVLAQVYSQHSPSVHDKGKAIVSGVQGEFHQIGAHMVADVLDFDGWDVRFLGTNLPYDSILAAIEEHQATVVGLSVTMLLSAPKLAVLIQEIKQRFASTRVMVGGSLVVNRYIEPVSMGADGSGDSLQQARELAQSW